MLANGKYRSIIASTLPEIRGALPLVKEGLLEEVIKVSIASHHYLQVTERQYSSVFTGYRSIPGVFLA